MRHDQLVRVSLLLRKRAARLDALGRIWDRAIESRPAGAESKRGDHHARIAEDGLGLNQTLAFHAADQAIRVHVDIAEGERGGVAQPDTMLIFGLIMGEALRSFFYD